jgi:hypothetical protein
VLRLVHPSRTIAIRRWGDGDRAREANAGALVLVPDVEDRDAPAWELSVDGGLSRSVIMASESPEGSPLVVGAEWAGCLWLAHGRRVYAFPDDLALVRWVDLESSVAEVRVLPDHGLLVAVYETGVTAIGEDLAIRWSLATDLVTNKEWRGESVLAVKQMDGPILEINLLSGATLELGS